MRIFNAVIIIVMVSSVVAADAYTIYGILKYPNNTAVQYEEIFIDCEPHAYDCAKFSGESTMSDFGGGYRLELAYCLLYTSPSPRDYPGSRMPSSA